MATVPPLTPEADALLNAIASTESGGDWNVIYGGQRFNDYSSHPGVMVTIKSGPNKGQKSSAAGKFQITKTTYDRVAPKLGITDFSPESQKQIAWYLANEDYGPGLQQALQSGDPAVIKGVAKALSSTWTSLPSGIEAGTNGTKFLTAYNRSLTNGSFGDVSPAASFSAIKGSVPTPQLGSVDERLLGMLGTGAQLPTIPSSLTPVSQKSTAIPATLPEMPKSPPEMPKSVTPPNDVSLSHHSAVTFPGGYDGTKQMVSYQPWPSRYTINPDAAVQMAKDRGVITGLGAMAPNGAIWSGGFGMKGMGDTIAEQLGASGAGTFNTKNNVLTLSPDTMNQISAGLAKIPAPIRDMFGTNPSHYVTSNPNISKVATATIPKAETFPLPIPRPSPPQRPQAPSTPTSAPTAAQMAAIRAVPPSSYYTGTDGPVISSAAPFSGTQANSPGTQAFAPTSQAFAKPNYLSTPQITPAQRAAISAVPPSSYYPAAPTPAPVYQPNMLGRGLPSSPYMPPVMLPNDAAALGISIPSLPQTMAPITQPQGPVYRRPVNSAPQYIPPPMATIATGKRVPVGTVTPHGGVVQANGSINHGSWSTPGPGQDLKWWQANSMGYTV